MQQCICQYETIINLKMQTMKQEHDFSNLDEPALKDNVLIMSGQADLNTHLDYLHYAHDHETREYSEKEIIQIGNRIKDNGIDEKERKRMIGILAHLGTPLAYRQLEEYHHIAPEDMKVWAEMAMMECRMFLEADLKEDDVFLVAGGLGGDKKRLRYWILLLPANENGFADNIKRMIEEEAVFVAKRRNCIVEEVKHHPEYTAITVLIPLVVALDDFVGDVAAQCNPVGGNIRDEYFATNSHYPDEAELQEIFAVMNSDQDEYQENR